ncbi:MAG: radical SAM protein [Thermoplasmatota archaeon]
MISMKFYYPGKKFPSLSVTGGGCGLSCPHCKGRYLQEMKPVVTPDKLLEVSKKLADKGANGFLLSGGCDNEGRVPLEGYYNVLKEIKEETDLLINVHTGLASEEMARSLSRTGVDMVSYDVIGSSETIELVYGLDKTPEDYLDGYRILKKKGLRVAPHITVGLHEGRLKGESKALKMVEDTEILILNMLIPSDFGETVDKDDFLGVVDEALSTVEGKVVIGCMRERGRSGLEIEALRRGVGGIVIPSRKTLDWAESRYDIEKYETCCVF